MTLLTISPKASVTSLPHAWSVTPLSRVAKALVSGGTPSTKMPDHWEGNIPWTTSAPISKGDVLLSHAQRFISKQGLLDSACNLVPAGNLLVGTRVGVGKAVVNTIDIAISQDLTGVIVDPKLADPMFIAFQIKTERVQIFFDERKRGTTIKGISRYDLEALELHLPPLVEQRAISRVLCTLREAKQARQRELELERERKAALMEHLFAHGTRGEPRKETAIGEMPESWQVVRLGDISTVAYGLTVNQDRRASREEVPYLTVANVTRGALRLGDIKEIGILEGDLQKYRLQDGDVLLVEGNGNPKLLGSAAVWHDELPLALHQNHLIRARPNREKVVPEWVMGYLNCERGRSQLLGKGKTSNGLHSINSRLISDLLIPLPSLVEQEQGTQVIVLCDAKILSLECELARLDELFRAMLEELMTGRLSVLPLSEVEGQLTE